jgi:pseudouridine-5'-phosphate glycosidase
VINPSLLDVRPEVAAAISDGRPVVALESTLISHGLPWSINLETAREAEAAIRKEGAIPATIAVIRGRPTIGLGDSELEMLAQGQNVSKASRRDLAGAVAQERTAATTVAASMFLAHQAGIRVLATGGIGGAHRGVSQSWDISSDLVELARTPVAVVCSGAKSILDIPRTLEVLETLGVPVVGYETSEFPAFYVRSSGESISARVNSPKEAAAFCTAHWNLRGAGVVLAQPVPTAVALLPNEHDEALAKAESEATAQGIRGPALTPFLLARMAKATGGKSLRANRDLVVNNARLGSQVARMLPSATWLR